MKKIEVDLGEHRVSLELDGQGNLHGKLVIYGTNGSSSCEFCHGKKHGEYREYFSDVLLTTEGTYEDGKKVGTWKFHRDSYYPTSFVSEDRFKGLDESVTTITTEEGGEK